MNVFVRGEGIAARCCAHLLRAPEWSVAVDAAPRPKLPAIMMGAATVRLFEDVFMRNDLFDKATRIRRRVVAWGTGAEPRELEHQAVVLSEQALVEGLGPSSPVSEMARPDWEILASRRPPDERHIGWRSARAIPVRLRDPVDETVCWVESLNSGWLFLLPGWLLAVGEPEVEESRLVKPRIAEWAGSPAEFAAHPRIAWPLCGDGWLACGTGALAFDPLCGDGSGNALREGILAAAVLRAAARGMDPAGLLEHYRTRLLAAFRRHLELSREFYRGGGQSPWWRTQADAVTDGLDWCARQMPQATEARYRLRGFDLEPAAPPASP